METSSADDTRSPCFIEEVDDDDGDGDYGLSSLAEMEAGVSGNHCYQEGPFSRSFYCTRRKSPRSCVGVIRICDSWFNDHHKQTHFLDSCFLCNKPLGENCDIFMYRGDTPFCSEECREEQIENDEAKEKKKWKFSSSMKALRKKEPTKAQNCTVRTGTVSAA